MGIRVSQSIFSSRFTEDLAKQSLFYKFEAQIFK